MKITKRQLRRIIKESILNESRAERLTLWLRLDSRGNELELYVKESDTIYPMGMYVDESQSTGGLAGLKRDFKADHGMEIPPGTIVIDYDGIGMDDLPIEQAYEWVSDAYAGL